KNENNIKTKYKEQNKELRKESYEIRGEGSQIPNINSNVIGQKIVDIIVMVPNNSYIVISPYVKDIKAALKELEYLRKTGTETPIIVDDDKKAYTMSIEYVLQKKLEG